MEHNVDKLQEIMNRIMQGNYEHNYHNPMTEYLLAVDSICDWILENCPDCHTGPIPFYWPS